MATLLSITNKVLKRLREDTVADLSDDYANLVASFVADVHQEVNDACRWSALDHFLTITLVPSQRDYDLSATTNDGGDVTPGSQNVTNSGSILLYNPHSNRPHVWIYEEDSPYGRQMQSLSPYALADMYRLDTSLESDNPEYFDIVPTSEGDGLRMTIWPTPSATRTIIARFNTPEDTLDPDSDSATEIKLPERPIYLGALYLALNERGEEIGEPGGISERRYQEALSAAIEVEIRNRERQGEFDWQRI